MNIVFVGGSRQVSRLSALAKQRLNNIVSGGFQVVVGDAAGADKAVQKFLLDAAYDKVTVYCSGTHVRNNLGDWEIRRISAPNQARGFQFFAAKDREMAKDADFGLMIWDGKSAGTALNILRLLRAGKKAVMLNVPENQAITFKEATDWIQFVSRSDRAFVESLRSRATIEEWMPVELDNAAVPALD